MLTKLGLKRLTRLAAILDTADKEHRRKGEPVYDQKMYVHPCGSPACAAGHWAEANKQRWVIVPRLNLAGFTGIPALRKHMYLDVSLALLNDFGLTPDQYCKLFSSDGCGGAKTAQQAAAYIRRFVARAKKGA